MAEIFSKQSTRFGRLEKITYGFLDIFLAMRIGISEYPDLPNPA